MKKEKVGKILHQSIQKNGAVTLYRLCDPVYKTIWPLAVSEKLILGCKDNDFLLDGFEILRIKDIHKIYAQDSLYDQIMRHEHLLYSITTPNICIQWSKKPRIIPYKEITRISFDGRYEQTYGRYVTKNFSE